MNGQLDLFSSPPAIPGSDTSEAAAEAIRPTVKGLRAAVFACIIGRGPVGATDAEIQAALELPSDTERPRRRELVRLGMVRDSGQRRPTPSGRLAVVWSAVTAGDSQPEGRR